LGFCLFIRFVLGRGFFYLGIVGDEEGMVGYMKKKETSKFN